MKKILYSFGTLAAIATPVSAVVACGSHDVITAQSSITITLEDGSAMKTSAEAMAAAVGAGTTVDSVVKTGDNLVVTMTKPGSSVKRAATPKEVIVVTIDLKDGEILSVTKNGVADDALKTSLDKVADDFYDEVIKANPDFKPAPATPPSTGTDTGTGTGTGTGGSTGGSTGGGTGSTTTTIAMPAEPAFDALADLSAYKTALKGAFASLTTDGTQAVNTSTIDSATDAAAAFKAANDLNHNLHTPAVSSQVQITPNALPHKDAFKADTVSGYITKLKGLFAGTYTAQAAVDVSSITSATTVAGVNTAFTALAVDKTAVGGDNLSSISKASVTVPDATEWSASAISAYKDALVKLFTADMKVGGTAVATTSIAGSTPTEVKTAFDALVATITSGNAPTWPTTGIPVAAVSDADLTTYLGKVQGIASAAGIADVTGIAGDSVDAIKAAYKTVVTAAQTPADGAVVADDVAALNPDDSGVADPSPTFSGMDAFITTVKGLFTSTMLTGQTAVATTSIDGATVAALKSKADALALTITSGNAPTVTALPAADQISAADVTTYKTAVAALFAGHKGSGTATVVTSIAGTPAEAKAAADKLAATVVVGGPITVTPIPAFDDYETTTVSNYKAALIAQFHGLVTAQNGSTAVDTSTITGTPEQMLAAAQTLATAGAWTSGTSSQKDATVPAIPSFTAHKTATVDAFRTAVVAALKTGGATVVDAEFTVLKTVAAIVAKFETLKTVTTTSK